MHCSGLHGLLKSANYDLMNATGALCIRSKSIDCSEAGEIESCLQSRGGLAEGATMAQHWSIMGLYVTGQGSQRYSICVQLAVPYGTQGTLCDIGSHVQLAA